MSAQNSNPFVLPGLGQQGPAGQNPLQASMDMMQQAWQSMAGVGLLGRSALPSTMTTDELDKRISDLRAVENWLRLNLTALSSSIQALEVQRATIATIRSFLQTPEEGDGRTEASPLELALGIKPTGQARIKPSADAKAAEAPAAPQGGLPDAAQGWWNMLSQQFEALAAATAASMPAPAAGTGPEGEAAGQAPIKPAARKRAAPRTAKAPAKRAAARTRS